MGRDDLVFCSPALPHVSLLDRLAPVRAAGFAGLSVLPGDIWALEAGGMDAAEAGRRIIDAGLAIGEVDCIACWLPSHPAASAAHPIGKLLGSLTAERVIATAAAIGARSVVVIEMLAAPGIDEAAEGFARVCDLAAEHGLKAHIEFLPFGGIPDLVRADAIVAAAGRANGGLTIDSWHLNRSRSTLDQLAAIPGGRIHTVQINDGPLKAVGTLFEETVSGRLLPGAGEFDLVGLIRTLDGIGSDAPIGVEVFAASQEDQPVADVAQTWATSARAILHEAKDKA